MGAGAVLTVAEAAALLPIADAAARRWLRAEGLVSQLEGRAVVVWAAVLSALRAGAEPTATQARGSPRGAALPRVRLDPL